MMKSAGPLALVLIALLYMGAYYGTVTMDAGGGCIPFQTYRIGETDLPEYSQDFFFVADWIDNHIHLAQCKKPLSIHISLPPAR